MLSLCKFEIGAQRLQLFLGRQFQMWRTLETNFFKIFFFLRWNFLKCSHKCSNEENDYAPNATGEAQENGDFHWGGGARKGVGGAREEGGGVNKKKERNELEFFKKKPSWNSTSATSTAEASHKKKKHKNKWRWKDLFLKDRNGIQRMQNPWIGFSNRIPQN